MPTTPALTAVLLDLDGTLVDSLYPHVVAWHDALQAAGHQVPMVRIHAAIGMGSDRLLSWLLGGRPDDADDIADDHDRRFLDRAERLVATPGAIELLDDLTRRKVPFVVATSAGRDERQALLAALGGREPPVVDADAVASSKPAPDLLIAACDQLDTDIQHAVMVGDAPWDALAAARIGIDAVGVRCGGFGDETLRTAGFTRIVDAPRDLVGTL